VTKLRKTCHTYGNYGKGKVYMRRIVLLALALVLLVGVGTGSADPVTIVSLTQHVVTDASLVLPVQHTHDEQQGSGNIVASSMLSSAGASASSLATLISGVSSDGRVFSGTATASASTQGTALVTARANGFSAFVVGFALTAPQQFTFEGDFTGNGQGSVWQAILFASPATPNTRMLFSFLGLDTRSIMESGILPAGQYAFDAEAGANLGGIGTLSESKTNTFTFSLSNAPSPSPTPEPATLLMLGTGLGGVLIRRFKTS